MTLKQYLVAGSIILKTIACSITPATGWWFSFFAISAFWNLISGVFAR